jgi:stearoyl-CoA desaturase (delta-9 desaturase)
VAVRHGVHWEYLIPITTVHMLACLALLPWCFSWSGLVIALVGTHVFGMGINLGYHRLLTHRSLKVPLWLERTLATIALCCLEDTPARWVATHRLHHVHSDEPEDPHTPRDGVSWSHAGWLFRRSPDRRTLSFLDKYARDILADRYFRFLERHPTSTLWIYLAHAAIFALAGLLVGRLAGGDWTHGVQLGVSWLVWGAFVRTVLVWHMTWSVNSLSHLFGYRTYDTGEDSRNNWLVALLAAGEGWHNNHHRFQSCTRNGFYWWEIDPTYYGLKMLSWTGLIWGLKPVPQSILDEGIHADHHASVAAAEAARAASAQSSHDYATLRRVVPVATAMAVATATASSANLPKKADGPAIRKDLSEEAHGLTPPPTTPPSAGSQAPAA